MSGMSSPKAKKTNRSGTRGSRDNHGGRKKPHSPQGTPTKVNVTLGSSQGGEHVNQPASPIASVSPRPKNRKQKNSIRSGVGNLNLNDGPSTKSKRLNLTSSETQKVMFSPAIYRKDEVRKDDAGNTEEKRQVKAHKYNNYDGSQHGERFDIEEIRVMKALPPYKSSVKSSVPRRICKAKEKGGPPITLALDLDETLVHCSVEKDAIRDAELSFSVNFNGMDYQVYVRTRPGLVEFLKQVSKWFEVIIFTASDRKSVV